MLEEQQLSIKGRVTLINRFSPRSCFIFFSFYKALKKVIGEITELQRRFLWGGNEDKNKLAWIKWDLVCSSKNRGGLGVKNLEAFNLVLISFPMKMET